MARHETGNFSNGLSKRHNNYFSMKQSKKRRKHWDYIVTDIPPEGDGGPNDTLPFVGFRKPERSPKDLIDWFKEFNFPTRVTSANDFALELASRGYMTQHPSIYGRAIANAIQDGVNGVMIGARLKENPETGESEIVPATWYQKNLGFIQNCKTCIAWKNK